MGKLAPEGMPGGLMLPEYYNSLFTMHATIMIFFAIMPILIGAFGNYVVPIQIGARDMAFPKLNMMSFWVAVPAAVMIIWSFFVTGGAAAGGWTSYAPLSAIQPRGQTLWLISLLILGLSSLLTAVNFITTIINLRAPGMTFFRLPLTVWALFITALLLLLALPVLSAALIMLLFDRILGTTFFLPAGLIVSGQPWPNAGGGQVLLWQHLFWFFGHPEVYIMILPAMGITSEILPVFSRKPIFGYRAMAYSMCGIAGLGFIVWGHHMFQSGMNPILGTTFMISTMVIAVPSAIKTFNWLGTLWGGNIRFTTPMLNALSFVSMFVIGGLSGIFMASTPVDIFIHDTYFIVGHIHYVLFGGSLFGAFAGLYYWYPKMFGRMMNETVGQGALGDHLRDVQPRVLPDALPRDARDAAPHLRLLPVHAPEGPAADEPVHDDLALRPRGGAGHPGPELLALAAPRQARGPEPVAREHPRVADELAAPARELRRTRPDRLPRALRVQRAGPRLGLTGRRTKPRRPGAREVAWLSRRSPGAATGAGLHRFAVLTAAATLCLIVAGGLVTSTESGLSVPDWPTTYGQNMFTFPLSKMVGGIRFEHTHRLIASGVGMLTVVLAIWLARREPRRWVRRLGYFALGAVVAQGLLGGLTVLLFLPPAVSVAHACLAQTFFCLTVAIAVVTSRALEGPRARQPPGRLRRQPGRPRWPRPRSSPCSCSS